MITLKLRIDELSLENMCYLGYGINVFDDETKKRDSIPDISLSKDGMIEFINQCNTLEVESVHLPCLIEDFMAQ